MSGPADALSAEEILARLGTAYIGRHLERYTEIDSTNTRAVALARAGAPEGTLVLAERQTAGRGRLGRRWHAPPGSALLMSLLLRPPLPPTRAQWATMVCAVAAAEAVEATAGLEVGIKWPNDLVVQGRKLGGVLTELGARDANTLDYVVVGLGLNVNLDPAALLEAITPATSLAAELGRPISRLDLLLAWLIRVEAHYGRLRVGVSPREAWRRRLATLGQPVQVGSAEEVVAGVAEDVDEDGALLVRTAGGALRRMLAGDVTLRGHRLAPPGRSEGQP
jgi:BirA family biotin operon repressor/biotin-[acetyl-CoA-carboxylase] ligase